MDSVWEDVDCSLNPDFALIKGRKAITSEVPAEGIVWECTKQTHHLCGVPPRLTVEGCLAISAGVLFQSIVCEGTDRQLSAGRVKVISSSFTKPNLIPWILDLPASGGKRLRRKMMYPKRIGDGIALSYIELLSEVDFSGLGCGRTDRCS